MRVAFVGRGKVGRALCRRAEAASLDARLVSGTAPTAEALRDADLVLLTVPDAAVPATGAQVARLAPGSAIAHCAGALGPDALAEASSLGAAVGAMHPLLSFADPTNPPSTEDALFLVGGDPRVVALATRLAHALGARSVDRAVHGPAYHAAAALVANGAAALAFHAVRLLESLGIPPDDATAGISSLLASVAENVRRIGVPAALTGPIARGDADTVRAHRRAIASNRSLTAAYDGVAEAVLGCAEAAGLPEARAQAVRSALRWTPRDLRPSPKPAARRTRSEPRRRRPEG